MRWPRDLKNQYQMSSLAHDTSLSMNQVTDSVTDSNMILYTCTHIVLGLGFFCSHACFNCMHGALYYVL